MPRHATAVVLLLAPLCAQNGLWGQLTFPASPGARYTLANAAGVADWSIAMPLLPASAGFELFVQGGVLVLGFHPGGLVFTRGIACTVGR
jgi:hypothetical protein